MSIPKAARVASGEVTAGQLRNQYGAEGALAALRMFGVTAVALSGTPPALGRTEWLVQVGIKAGAVFSGGSHTLSFTNAFPTGCLAVLVWGTGGVGLAYGAGTASQVVVNTLNGSNPTIGLQWIAVGW